MQRLFALIVGGLLLVALIFPVAASAQDGSAIDEYVEGVPTAGGNSHPGAGGGGDRAPLPSGVADELEAAGADGQAAANLAETPAPPAEQHRGNAGEGDNAGDQSGANSGTRTSVDRGSGIGGIVDAVVVGSGDSGMGILFPAILVSALVAAVAFILARRGRHSGAQGDF
jgi:hypothetical protein